MLSLTAFITKYSQAISEGYAAVFAGAGLCRDSGYVNWKELLADFAESIRLDINKESDLVEVAQFYCNANGGRGALNDAIYEKFTKPALPNKSLKCLTSLPINTFWTTNYDKLLELELQSNGKSVDVKITPESLATVKVNRDAVVYKMHGDCDDPARCVITKDDYESYNLYRQLFTVALQGDLVSKTFLFIGFSFEDPNLDYILSRIRVLLGENRREHYFLTAKLTRGNRTQKQYQYEKIKREHRKQDLLRYGIHTLELDYFSEIPTILERVSKKVFTKRIFLAGSCRDYGEWSSKDAYSFMFALGQKIIKNGLSLHTGLIEGVGPQVTNGALTAINELQLSIDKHLRITTLPLINGKADHMDSTAKSMFQNNMISETGIVIFLFGNQYYNNELKSSKGVWGDYTRAKEQGKFMIPVGSTGFASKDIYMEMHKNTEDYPYLQNYWRGLLTERNPERLSDLIISIINSIIKSV